MVPNRKLGESKYEEINTPLIKLINEHQTLVAVHRGSGHMSIPENTINSTQAALRQGADIVEVDIIESTDGEWFCYHDGYEMRDFGLTKNIKELSSSEIAELNYSWSKETSAPVEKLSDLLKKFPATFFNIDRSWWWWPSLLDQLSNFDYRYFLLKSHVKDQWLEPLISHSTKFPFIAMVFSAAEVEEVKKKKNLNLVGFELLAEDSNHEFVDPEYIRHLKDSGYLVLTNAIVLSDESPLFAGYDDEISLLCKPELGWGKLIELGSDVIQTDWPMALRYYLQRAHNREMSF